jgi:hypothetical protein
VGGDPGGGDVFRRLAAEIDVAAHLVELIRVDREVLGDLVGDRSLVLHAAPGILPDLAMRLAAVIFRIRVLTPFRVVVALRRVFREVPAQQRVGTFRGWVIATEERTCL